LRRRKAAKSNCVESSLSKVGRKIKREERARPAHAPPGSSLHKVHRTLCNRSALYLQEWMERIAERSEEILVLFLVLSRAGQSPAMDFLIREIEPTKLPGYTYLPVERRLLTIRSFTAVVCIEWRISVIQPSEVLILPSKSLLLFPDAQVQTNKGGNDAAYHGAHDGAQCLCP